MCGTWTQVWIQSIGSATEVASLGLGFFIRNVGTAGASCGSQAEWLGHTRYSVYTC